MTYKDLMSYRYEQETKHNSTEEVEFGIVCYTDAYVQWLEDKVEYLEAEVQTYVEAEAGESL